MKPEGHTETTQAERDIAGVLRVTLAENRALQQANERMRGALEAIADWCDAYPVESFKEPDWDDVKRLLGSELLTQVSAANMRHVLKGIRKRVGFALAEAGGETGR